MDYKNIFKNNHIETIDSLFQFINGEILYGWVDQSGKKHNGMNDADNYSLQKPEELLSNKLGICWDITELSRCFFKNMTDLKFETYYLFYEDLKGCPSHTILVFYQNDKVYWFEPMLNDKIYNYSGIHEYDSLNELLKDFKTRFIEFSAIINLIPRNYNRKRFYLYQYEQPTYHINGHQMRDHIDHSNLIRMEEE